MEDFNPYRAPGTTELANPGVTPPWLWSQRRWAVGFALNAPCCLAFAHVFRTELGGTVSPALSRGCPVFG